MMLWSLFKTAVYSAVDERNDKRRQARDLARIAQALEDIVDDGRARGADSDYLPPSKGK